MKFVNKKIFGIGAAIMLMFISIPSGMSFVKPDLVIEKELQETVLDNEKETQNANTCTFVVDMNQHHYAVQLSAEEADVLVSNINRLDIAFELAKNPKDKMRIFEEKLRVLRGVGILPPSFTVENMTKTAQWLKGIVKEHLQESSKDYSSNNQFLTDWDVNVGGFGAGLVVTTPFGQLVPFPLGEYIAVSNSTEVPIFTFPNNWTFILNFTVVIGVAVVLALFSLSAATFGWGFTAVPPRDFFLSGPFYSGWASVGVLSITIYWEVYPKVTLLDIGILGGLAVMLNGMMIDW